MDKQFFDQIILRCGKSKESQGYETILSTIPEINDELLPLLVPRSSTTINRNYFYKITLSNHNILVKLIIGDGKDAYGRQIAKSHNLIIPELDYYNFGGLNYFASPLWLNKVSLTSDSLLTINDFSLEIRLPDNATSLAASLLQLIFSYEYITLWCMENDDIKYQELQHLLAYVDLCIPPQLARMVSLKAYIGKHQLFLANITIIPVKTLLKKGSAKNKHIILDLRHNYNDLLKFKSISPLIIEMAQAPVIDQIKRLEFGELLLSPNQALKDPRIGLDFYSKLVKRFGLKLPWYQSITFKLKKSIRSK